MKKFTSIALTSLALATSSFAGQEISSAKESKTVVNEVQWFKDQELQTSSYGEYRVGNGTTHVGLFRDHAFGDGTEISFFFKRYFGLGAEYSSVYARESPDTNRGELTNHQVNLNGVGGNLYLRYPIESLHLAPYVYAGGGADFGDRRWANAHWGLGAEYRVIPSRLGLFVDGRFTYLGDRSFPDDNAHRGDLNFFSVRAGFKLVY